MLFNVVPRGIPKILFCRSGSFSYSDALKADIPQTTALSRGRMPLFCHCWQCYTLGITAPATTYDVIGLAGLAARARYACARVSSLTKATAPADGRTHSPDPGRGAIPATFRFMGGLKNSPQKFSINS
jgi:hypothetical protein